jgi:hypothetical protein
MLNARRRRVAAWAVAALLTISACSNSAPGTRTIKITIRNTSGLKMLVYGCPTCKPGGGIQVPPGSALFWRVKANEPKIYRLSIAGHTATCRPPRRTSFPPVVGHLIYKATKTGRCDATAAE